ncbi:DUF4157 domain-containing protein, partial [Nocardioides soli]
MSALLDRSEQAEPAPPVRRSLEVGAADDRAELEADAVAAQVLGRLAERHEHAPGCGHDDGVRRAPAAGTTGTIGAAGGTLDEGATGAIESARGGGSALDSGVRREMEAGFGHSLGDVRIHTDARADELSRQMSARAFTTGRDIFFARGEYDPTSAAGRHTLAHELAHTVQEGGPARRKLRGTAEALEQQGGGMTSGKFRKAIGLLTNWDKIVAGTKAYELEETKLLAGGKNPDPMVLMKAKPGMLKLLAKIQSAVKDWRKSNDSTKEDAKFERSRFGGLNNDIEENRTEDDRTKSGRRQAVALLDPRVGHEVSLLSAKDGQGWLSSLGLSTNQVTGTGRQDGGQVNQVSELHFKTESGEMSGFFKEDKGFNAKSEGHETEVGIRQVDPNYGARSIALYRLDQLFNAGVTARAEFAVHKNGDGKSVLGTVLESSKGTKAVDVKYHVAGDEKDPGSVDLYDPVLQRGLNKLQLLDAICGQLDRHMGNYFVQDDGKGNVTGVTGIDLDMAFGSKMTSVDYKGAQNYKGLPEYIDKEMGQKILQITPADNPRRPDWAALQARDRRDGQPLHRGAEGGQAGREGRQAAGELGREVRPARPDVRQEPPRAEDLSPVGTREPPHRPRRRVRRRLEARAPRRAAERAGQLRPRGAPAAVRRTGDRPLLGRQLQLVRGQGARRPHLRQPPAEHRGRPARAAARPRAPRRHRPVGDHRRAPGGVRRRLPVERSSSRTHGPAQGRCSPRGRR